MKRHALKHLPYGLALPAFALHASVAQATPPLSLPWQCGVTHTVTQGHNTSYSHRNGSAWAWDFNLGLGEAIYAPADGYVRSIRKDSNIGCCDSSCSAHANYVVIAFSDGTEASMVHMQQNSSPLSLGQQVRRGQFVGRVGLTGWVCGAHHHFQIQNTCAGMGGTRYCQSIPASFLGVGDPQYGQSVTSDNCGQVCEAETCNGKDDDCDGEIDEGVDRACGSDEGECRMGTQHCRDGAYGECEGEIRPELESCDELDNDCDGVVDDDQVCEIEEAWQAALFDSESLTDVNGDGTADLCALDPSGLACVVSDGNTFHPLPRVDLQGEDLNAPEVFSTLRLGDLNSDGLSDACLRLADGVSCWLATASGFETRFSGPALSDAAGWNQTANFSTIRFADVDGDGRADLCARSADGLTCYPSLADRFGDGRVLTALSDAAGFGDVNRYGTVRMGDVNGDGSADVCAKDADQMACWLATPDGFQQRIAGPPWSDAAGFGDWRAWSTIRLADVNGDGRADLCAREEGTFSCYLFDGEGFRERLLGPPLPSPEWDTRQALASIRLSDLDGDGRADLCLRSGDGIDCWLAAEKPFDRQVQGPTLAAEDGWNDPASYRTLRLGDIDGDGKADVCGRATSGVQCWLFEGRGFGERLSGPAWSDPEGWATPARYHSLRLGGLGFPSGSAGGAGGNSGSAGSGGTAPAGGAAGASAQPTAEDSAGCGCGLAARSQAPLAALSVLTGLVLLGRRRRRERWL